MHVCKSIPGGQVFGTGCMRKSFPVFECGRLEAICHEGKNQMPEFEKILVKLEF